MGRFTVLLSRRVAIDDGVVMATDDDDDAVRYDEVTGVTAAGDEFTDVVVSAFLFTPLFVCTHHTIYKLSWNCYISINGNAP